MSQTVLVDIDDTLTGTQSAILEYINAKSSRPFRFEDMTRDHREGNVPEYERLVQEFLSRPDLLAANRPYANALAAMQRLHAAGYVIHIVSSRREVLHEITVDWLKEHGFAEYVDRIHPRFSTTKGEQHKLEVARKVQPVAAFDDTYDVALALADTDIQVFLIDKPWNAADSLPDNVIRSGDFAAAVDRFLAEHDGTA